MFDRICTSKWYSASTKSGSFAVKTIEQILGRKAIHPFPARMAPSIALDAIGKRKERLRVLDPMAGSGTVVAVARAGGHRAVGIDCDPLAVLNAGVWTTAIDHDAVNRAAIAVLQRSRAVFDGTPIRDSYPSSADDETRRFLRFWFDQRARRELHALSVVIADVQDRTTRNALWSAFSRMIIAKKAGASLAMDLSHSRPHKSFDKALVRPFEQFLKSVAQVVSNCPKRGQKGIGPAADVRLGDCRNLPFNRASFDLVVTSPPYLNAIDYLRCSKFSLVWMGHVIPELRTIRSNSVGTECTGPRRDWDEAVAETVSQMCDATELSPRNKRLLAKYVGDMMFCIKEVARVLRIGGEAVYVIGNNQMGQVFVSNSAAVKVIAKSEGLSLESEYSRELPPNRRYLPPPTAAKSGSSFQARMRTEVILRFARVG